MTRFLPLALCAAMLTACASAKSTMIAPNMAVISGATNSPAAAQKLVDRLLTEAATTTRAHGYRYFTILKAEDTGSTGTRHVPGNIYENLNGIPRRFGPTASLTPTNVPGYAYMGPGTSVPFFHPGLDITIQMYREGEIDPFMQDVWNADIAPGETPTAR